MNQLIYNALRTPDGTVIESFGRHDYVTHIDANGQKYMVDGGLAYERHSIHGDEELLHQYLTDVHEHNRTWFHWGTRGPEGDQPLKHVPLKALETEHIRAILKTQGQISGGYIEDLMLSELAHRLEKAA